MPWKPCQLRGDTVYARTNASGALDVGEDGRVDIRYKDQDGAKVYRAAKHNLGDDATTDAATTRTKPAKATRSKAPSSSAPSAPRGPANPNEIIIYTDGACSGNPGPAGLGAVILDRGERHEISENLGTATNNIAELCAIERALEHIKQTDRARPVAVHTDSSYCIGILSKGFKAKANRELILRILTTVRKFPKLRFVKVAGHAGVPENERADELARRAVGR